jgi:cytochrome c556
LSQNGRALTPKLCRISGAISVALLAIVGITKAQQPPPAKPMVPTSASSILMDPKQFDGVLVTVFSPVERIVSPTSFTIDQDPSKSGGELLVVATILSEPPVANAYVTVIGEVSMADGRPVIKATSVLNAKMVDLAKRVLPPMTAEEAAFDATMKKVGPAFNALRSAVTDANADAVKSNTAVLKQAFADTEAFFKTRSKADAQKWAAEARAHVEALEKSAGKGDEAKAAVSALQQSCSSCHAVYRERQDDGSYRIRGEVK